MPRKAPEVEKYADALLALGQAADVLSHIERDLVHAQDLIGKDEMIRRFMADPRVLDEGKRQAIADILADHVHPTLSHFILILLQQNALPKLDAITAAFFERLSDIREKATGELTTAAPLPDKTLRRIEKEVGRVLQKDVVLRVRVDPAILGGVRVRIGDFVMDGTVDKQLEEIRRRLLA